MLNGSLQVVVQQQKHCHAKNPLFEPLIKHIKNVDDFIGACNSQSMLTFKSDKINKL